MTLHGNKFSERLQYLAFEKKLIQADLVLILRQASSTVSRWWNGEIVPGAKNLRKISDYFSCDYNWLKTGEGVPFPEKKYQMKSKVNLDPGKITATISPGNKELYQELKKTNSNNIKYKSEKEPSVEDMLHMTKIVLNSNTVYKSALASNVRAFYKAVLNEEEMNKMQKEISEIKEGQKRLEEMLISLGAQVPKRESAS